MLYTVSAEGLAQQALDERVGYYKTARPHQALEDATPVQRFHPAIGMETFDLCEWAEGDDALTTAEDVAACIRSGSASLPPRSGFDYVAALDIGTRRDLTALVVGHADTSPAGRVVVIDRVLYWRPSPGDGRRVALSEVEAVTLRLCRVYRTSRLRLTGCKPSSSPRTSARAGLRPAEFVFSAAGANRLARSLYGALRDRELSLPGERRPARNS